MTKNIVGQYPVNNYSIKKNKSALNHTKKILREKFKLNYKKTFKQIEKV